MIKTILLHSAGAPETVAPSANMDIFLFFSISSLVSGIN